MKELFIFSNETKNVTNKKGIHQDGGVPYFVGLVNYNIEFQRRIFMKVIDNNNWNRESFIIAYGDCDTKICYDGRTNEIWLVSEQIM